MILLVTYLDLPFLARALVDRLFVVRVRGGILLHPAFEDFLQFPIQSAHSRHLQGYILTVTILPPTAAILADYSRCREGVRRVVLKLSWKAAN